MRPLEFYEVVRILDSERTRALGIANQRGIVDGLPPHLLDIQGEQSPDDTAEHQYGVAIGDVGYALYRTEIEPTGERVEAGALYDGSSIQVSPEGDLLRPPKEQGEADE